VKKRIMSMFLTVCMLLTMLPMTVLADTEQILHYSKPTNARWDGYDMVWDWTNDQPDSPTDVEITLYRASGDADTLPDADTYWSPYSWRYFLYSKTPSLGDFDITQPGWYCYDVRIIREEWYTVEGSEYDYYREWVSEVSDKSDPVYFGGADPLSSPTDLAWDGSNMTWTMSDVSNVDCFELMVVYTCSDDTVVISSGDTTEWVWPEEERTTYSHTLEDVGGEEWLMEHGEADYTFRVRAISADATVASNSYWADCDEKLHYNPRAQKLAAPTGLAWDDHTMTWTEVQGANSYDVELWYQRTEELTPEEELEFGAGADSSAEIFTPFEIKQYKNITQFPTLNNDVIYSRGGDYWFVVKANSADPSQNMNSDWSEQSGKLSVDGRFALDVPAAPAWDTESDEMIWTWNGGADQTAMLRNFRVEVFYRADQTAQAMPILMFSDAELDCRTDHWREFEQASADGYYSFRVMARTEDRQILEDSDWSAMSEEYYYDAPDPLAAPTDLAWDGSTATWKPSADADMVEYYDVFLYYLGQDGTDEREMVTGFGEDITSLMFTAEDLAVYGDGVYFFTVRAISKDIDAALDSDQAESPLMIYTTPDQKLAAPTGLCWDGNFMKWDVPTDTDGVAWYEIECWGSDNRIVNRINELDQFSPVTPWDTEYLGDNITFRVRAVSADATQYRDSDWVTCETYYQPPEGLPVPTDLAWDGRDMVWSWDGDESLLNHFVIKLYWAEDETSEPIFVDSMGTNGTRIPRIPFEQWAEYAGQDGLYSFTVMAYSRDLSAASHSDDSDWSGTYQYTMAEPLAPPTDLTWDGTTAVWTPSPDEEAGLVNGYRVTLYRLESGEYVEEESEYCYDDSCHVAFRANSMIPGESYRFGVYAVSGDFDLRGNSAEVISAGAITYEPATIALPAPENLFILNNVLQWDAVDNDAVNSYRIQIYGVDTEMDIGYTATSNSLILNTNVAGRVGSKIQFRVQALSGDLNRVGDSGWSRYSQVYIINDNEPVIHTVTFMDGSTQLDQRGFIHGSSILKPADPAKDGFTFVGWYTDPGLTIPYDFAARVVEDLTLYAKWSENSVAAPPPQYDDDDDDDYYVPVVDTTITTTERNEDGSTTTTTTDKSTGTVTEVTKYPDGATNTVITDKAGTVTETNKTADGVTGTVVTDKAGRITEISAAIPVEAAREASENETAVTLPIQVAAADTSAQADQIQIDLPARVDSVTVEIPVSDVTPGTVVILVNENGTETVVNTTGMTENGVVAVLSGDVTVKVVNNAKAFDDVKQSDWFSDAVDFASARELLNGVGDGSFGHDMTTNRAMVAQILHNMEGKQEHSFTGSFGDVDETAWYADAIHWAAENDIIAGTGDGNFDPNAAVTREQLAVMLWKYAGAPDSDHPIDHFNDKDQISDWAQTALSWAVEHGLMSGKGNGQLDPGGHATRSEVASVLMNFYKNVKY